MQAALCLPAALVLASFAPLACRELASEETKIKEAKMPSGPRLHYRLLTLCPAAH